MNWYILGFGLGGMLYGMFVMWLYWRWCYKRLEDSYDELLNELIRSESKKKRTIIVQREKDYRDPADWWKQ
jgi:hypothetical protein